MCGCSSTPFKVKTVCSACGCSSTPFNVKAVCSHFFLYPLHNTTSWLVQQSSSSISFNNHQCFVEDENQQSIPFHSCTWLMGTMYAILVELGLFRLNHLILPLLEVTLLEDIGYDWTINVSILIYVFHLILFIP